MSGILEAAAAVLAAILVAVIMSRREVAAWWRAQSHRGRHARRGVRLADLFRGRADLPRPEAGRRTDVREGVHFGPGQPDPEFWGDDDRWDADPDGADLGLPPREVIPTVRVQGVHLPLSGHQEVTPLAAPEPEGSRALVNVPRPETGLVRRAMSERGPGHPSDDTAIDLRPYPRAGRPAWHPAATWVPARPHPRIPCRDLGGPPGWVRAILAAPLDQVKAGAW